MINEIKSFEERKQELLELGKKNDNKVTFEEMAEHLKGLEPDSDSLDELYNMFVQNGIEIVQMSQMMIKKMMTMMILNLMVMRI